MGFLWKPFRYFPNNVLTVHILLVCFACTSFLTPSYGTTYNNVTQIFTDKLASGSGYNTAVRPLKDQLQLMNVSVTFDIVAIVEVDDINQKFVVNGFLTLSWTDQILAWDPFQYGYIYSMNPYPKDIWRPRLVLANTLQNRDLFEDDYCPTVALYNGLIMWYPGSLFPTSCKLNLMKYPFDEQMCAIDLYSMDVSASAVQFLPMTNEVGTSFFVESGEWEMKGTAIECGVSGNISFFQIKFVLKRRPGFFIINIVLPVVLLSFLNIMVFLIPVESGEKISYGITVLLALSVFMSIVSEMLPRSSDTTPLVTLYLMVLLLISVCSVIVAILIVSFHHRDEKETKRQKASSTFKSMFNKVKILKKTTATIRKIAPAEDIATVEGKEGEPTSNRANGMIDVMKKLTNLKKTVPSLHDSEKDKHSKHNVNKWRIIGRYIDIVSLLVFMAIWISVTIGFLVKISS